MTEKGQVFVRRDNAQRNLRAELDPHDGLLAGYHPGESVMSCCIRTEASSGSGGSGGGWRSFSGSSGGRGGGW